MMRINLLPHRQARREERQREFNLMATGTLILAIAVVFLGHTVIGAKTSAQDERNQRLLAAIAKLDKEIAEIKELQFRISEMLEKKQVVENLQSTRSHSVILLDEISRKLPQGTFLKTIRQKGNFVEIEGVADANARIAALLRNLGESKLMHSPNIVQIQAVMIGNIKYNDFKMNVRLQVQKPPQDMEPDKVQRKSS
jgi:type IV pilus assembly protein PilN